MGDKGPLGPPLISEGRQASLPAWRALARHKGRSERLRPSELVPDNDYDTDTDTDTDYDTDNDNDYDYDYDNDYDYDSGLS